MVRTALKPSDSLRARVAADNAPKLKFKLRIVDAGKHRFTVVRKVRPAS